MELNRLATIHTEYASIITEEIEQPLRSAIQNNTNYATIHQVNLPLFHSLLRIY